MAVLNNVKDVGGGFSNDSQLVPVVYDFAVDGGAIADYDVLTADGACVVEFLYADVETAVTSSDAILFDLGKGAGGTEMWSDVVKAELALDAIFGPDTAESAYVELADGEKIVMGVEAFAATAGKFKMMFRVYPRS